MLFAMFCYVVLNDVTGTVTKGCFLVFFFSVKEVSIIIVCVNSTVVYFGRMLDKIDDDNGTQKNCSIKRILFSASPPMT
jgi:hypothetical protein